MDNMFTKFNSKYDVVASHIRQMDVQIAQTAETIKRQQGTCSIPVPLSELDQSKDESDRPIR